MATCNDCLYHETCHGRIAYCMDIDEATGKEILDIEKRCKDFKNKADFVEVVRCRVCKYSKIHTCAITGIETLFCDYGQKPVAVEPTYYCGRGERKTDDDD